MSITEGMSIPMIERKSFEEFSMKRDCYYEYQTSDYY